jgi:hypothetical protein
LETIRITAPDKPAAHDLAAGGRGVYGPKVGPERRGCQVQVRVPHADRKTIEALVHQWLRRHQLSETTITVSRRFEAQEAVVVRAAVGGPR